MKVFGLGYPFLWKGRKSLACRRQAKRLSYRVQTTETHIDSGGIRWDSDGPVTQSMIASIIWYGHRSIGNGFCEVTFESMWASCFIRIAEDFGFDIQEMEVAEDHVHIFLSFPPRYSISKVVGILKSISGSGVFREHPEVKRELWGGEFWEDGYFARTVGDKVTSEVIEQYIRYHRQEQKGPLQLDLFGDGSG